jgi:acyl-CoA thioester hydrolase
VDTRREYRHFQSVPTRWLDNDVYGHVNNVIYYALFDTVINRWLIERGGLDIRRGEVIGVCAESHCRYREGFSFPEIVEAGLRVGELKRTSVRYEIGIFREAALEAAAAGWFVHVFVDRSSRRPTPIPAPLREALEQLRSDAATP